MASQALLSSKIVVNEEPPQIRSITAQPTAVLGMVGIAERGPIGQPVLCLSYEEFRNTFGGYTTEAADTVAAVEGFFEEGGQFLWFVRTVHYTDITDEDSHTATSGTLKLQTAGSAASGASLLAGNVAPYNFAPGQTILISVEGNAADTVTLDAAAATITAGNTENYALTDGMTLTVSVNGGPAQTATFNTADFSSIGAATAAEVAAVISADIVGVTADVDSNAVRMTTDGQGTGFNIEVTGGTANAILGFSTSQVDGTGDVANIDAVSIAELKAVIEADASSGSGVVVTDSNNRALITTVATGASATLEVTGGTGTAAPAFPSGEASGSAAVTATDTLRIDARWAGAYSDEVTITIAAASSGESDRFNLNVLRNGVVDEVFANLSMLDTDPNYVESVLNAAVPAGSLLVTATDLDAVSASATAAQQRPANVTAAALTGGGNGLVGLADSDFSGDSGAKTGLYALDGDDSQPITLLSVPARRTAVVHNAMLNYCEVDRTGFVFAILDSPAGLTAQGVLDYVRNQALLEGASEFGAFYYPLVRVINPNTNLFGDNDYIEVPPSGHIAGVMSRTDNSQPGGVYQPPAGQENGRLRTIIGFEILAGRQQPETFDVTKRDLIYPALINPLRTASGLRVIDGVRCLKSDGNFPTVAERRGASFIELTIKNNLEFARFRNNNDTLRAEVSRVVEKFLIDQMNVGAFRSNDPATAFFVDFGRGLNPDSVVFQGQLIGRIGLATNKPAEFIILNFTQDTRALTQELSQ